MKIRTIIIISAIVCFHFIFPRTDSDGDGFEDSEDNCPTVYNIYQLDFNNNDIGDICEDFSCAELYDFQFLLSVEGLQECNVDADCVTIGDLTPYYWDGDSGSMYWCCGAEVLNEQAELEFPSFFINMLNCSDEFTECLMICDLIYPFCEGGTCQIASLTGDECWGNGWLDDCGVCCDGSSGNECSYYTDEWDYGGAFDCSGNCYGEAYINECGCVGGAIGIEPDNCYGCLEEEAFNFDPNLIFDSGLCLYRGDLNQSYDIDILDIVYLVDIILNAPEGEYELWAGDFNLDDSIDVTDVVSLITHILAP
jgi:hypothetical protein